MGMIKVASYVLPDYVLRNLYYAYFVSRLCYGITIWGNTYETYLYPLRIVHNRCIRLISHADVRAHVSSLAKKLHILVFDDLYDFHVAIFMYKVFNEMHPPVILKMFSKLSSIHHITRKTTHDFFLPRIRLDVCKRFITFSGVTVWSRLDIETKLSICLHAFKTLLLTSLLSNYDD
jgi:hypothetical protein